MNALAERHSTAVAPPAPSFDLSPRNFEEALRLADYLAESEMVPKQYRKRAGDCLIAMQWGAEIGLKPMQALQSIAAINGKPNLYGDAGKALLLAHGCIIEEDDAEIVKANSKGRCRITRPGRPPVERTFSLDDAKQAGLWNKEGPWRAYPYRQMAWRAFWFAARDAAADLLRGMGGFEEAADIPPEKYMGAVDEVKPPAGRPELPPYSQEAFDKNLPQWRGIVESGRKTGAALLTMFSTKNTFTPEQQAALRALDTPAPAPAPAAGPGSDDFAAEYAAAEGQQP